MYDLENLVISPKLLNAKIMTSMFIPNSIKLNIYEEIFQDCYNYSVTVNNELMFTMLSVFDSFEEITKHSTTELMLALQHIFFEILSEITSY